MNKLSDFDTSANLVANISIAPQPTPPNVDKVQKAWNTQSPCLSAGGSALNPIVISKPPEKEVESRQSQHPWQQVIWSLEEINPVMPPKSKKRKKGDISTIPSQARLNKDDVYEIFSGLAKPKKENIVTIREGFLVVAHRQHGEYGESYTYTDVRILTRAIEKTVCCIEQLMQCKIDYPEYAEKLERVIESDRQRLVNLRERLEKAKAKQPSPNIHKGSIAFLLN